MARRLLALAILTLPAVALYAAQPPYIYFDSATGPIAHYQARVRTLTETVLYVSPDAAPEVELAMLPVEPYWIDARACKSSGRCGEWSPLHWNTMDLDSGGRVGMSDFVLFFRGDYGMGDFAELVTYWGDATVANAAGLRRYVDD